MAIHMQLPAKAYTFLVILECLGIAVAISSAIYTAVNQGDDSKEVIQLCVLALVVTVSFCYFSVDAVIRENWFQLCASYVAHFCLFLFTLWTVTNPGPDRSDVLWKIADIAFWVVTSLQILYLMLAWFVYESFGWYVYKVVGANELMQTMFATTQVFSTLLKLDCVCTTELLLMGAFFIYGDDTLTRDVVLASIAYIIQMAWTAWAYYGVRRENRNLVKYVLLAAWILPAYVMYQIVQAGLKQRGFKNFTAIIWGIYFAALMCFIFRILLVIYAYRCRRNFGRGLKERVFKFESQPTMGGGENWGTFN